MSKLDHPFKTPDDYEPKTTHVELFESLMEAPVSKDSEASKVFIILSTPRCGSTLFADVLSRTGLIGLCEEWINYEYFATYQKVLGVETFTLRNYFKFIISKTIKDTGVFSIKMHIPQVGSLKKDFDLDFAALGASYSVYLYRKHKIDQAVSLAKALATDKFRADEESREERDFDMLDISKNLYTVISHDKTYHTDLSAHTSEVFAYEDFQNLKVREPYDKVLKALGKTPLEAPYTTGLKKQRPPTCSLTEDFVDFITGGY